MIRLAKRWLAGWRWLLRHRDPCEGYRTAGWSGRRRLDLLVLWVGLGRPGTWRIAGVATALALVLLSLRWRHDLGGRLALLAVPLLTVLPWLPLVAHARRVLLRALLIRSARQLAAAPAGCCNKTHADACQTAPGTGRARRTGAGHGGRRGRPAGRS